MNILLIIVILIALWRGYAGLKKGVVNEVRMLFSLVLTMLVIALAILLYTSVKENNTRNIVLFVIAILIAGLAARLISLIFKSLSAIADLPVFRFADRLLGMAFGAMEAVVGLWIVYIVIGSFDTGVFGSQIAAWTMQSEILTKLYSMNQVVYWMAGLV
ncbi:MAG: CvpA family protein [Firmicutes bacterium]|nr:CvpA family protein [Bacillota bacterium]